MLFKMNSTKHLEQLISVEIEKIPNTEPVALLLSGGIDSSLVLSLLRETQPSLSILTFTIARDKNYPDILFARKIAQIFNTQHYEIIPSPEELDKFSYEFQQISKDEKNRYKGDLSLYILCRLAKKYTNVVVTGDGGDEIFGGYWLHSHPLGHLEKGSIKSFEEIHPETRKHIANMVQLGYRNFYFKEKSEENDFNAVWNYFVDIMLPRHIKPLMNITNVFGLKVYTPLWSKPILNFVKTLPFSERIGRKIEEQIAQKYLPFEIIKRESVGFDIALEGKQ